MKPSYANIGTNKQCFDSSDDEELEEVDDLIEQIEVVLLPNEQCDKNRHQSRHRLVVHRDIIFDSIQCLTLANLLHARTVNSRTLCGPCQHALRRLCPPRKVPPLTIDHLGVHAERLDGNGRKILVDLPFPKIPPTLESAILGFGRITIRLRRLLFPSNAQLFERVGNFLHLSKELLRNHDLLLDRFKCFPEFATKIANDLLSRLPTVRSIEADICFVEHNLLFESAAFQGTNRLRLNNYFDEGLRLGPREFQNCIDWLHRPTANGSSRSLVFCCYSSVVGFRGILLPLLVEHFRQSENAENVGVNPSTQTTIAKPKFAVLVLFPNDDENVGFPNGDIDMLGEPPMEHSQWENAGGDECLWVEPIRHGRDRWGRPLRDIVSVHPEEAGNGEDGERSVTFQALLGDSDGPPPSSISGFILIRGAIVQPGSSTPSKLWPWGNWDRPELFEAERQQMIHFEWW